MATETKLNLKRHSHVVSDGPDRAPARSMLRAVGLSADMLGPVESAYLLPRLGEIAAPVLVLWGEQDRLFPVEQLESLRQTCPLVEIHTFPDVGHWPYAEVPEGFNATLIDFLERRANG